MKSYLISFESGHVMNQESEKALNKYFDFFPDSLHPFESLYFFNSEKPIDLIITEINNILDNRIYFILDITGNTKYYEYGTSEDITLWMKYLKG